MALLRSYVATCCFTYDLPGQHALPAGRSSCGTGPMPCAACSGGPPAPRGSPGRGAAGAARRSPTPTCPRAGPQRTGGPPAHGGARASGRRTGHKNSGGVDPTGGGGRVVPRCVFPSRPPPPPVPTPPQARCIPPTPTWPSIWVAADRASCDMHSCQPPFPRATAETSQELVPTHPHDCYHCH